VAGPALACPAGEAGEAYECQGVTVTGERDAEPTIELAEDFAPVTELVVGDVYEGSGDPVQPGDTLTVQYVGVGQQSREVFDASWAGGQPATFPLDGVIQGWQQGMVGMTPGGRRLLVIPGSLAYGPEGRPPVIGPDETLVFVVDLVSAQPAG
jgi:peptidylprolyl isomerase